MAKKKNPKTTGSTGEAILVRFLVVFASVAALVCFILGGIAFFSGRQETADQAPTPTIRGTLPSSSPTKTPAPETAEPAATLSNEPEPEPSETVQQTAAPTAAPTEKPTQAPVQTEMPTSSPTSQPQATAPAATVNPTAPPVQQTQAPAQSGGVNGGSGGWGGDSTTNEITGSLSKTAYWVSGGKSYHFSKTCPSLSRSTNIQTGTLQDALNAGKTDPCNNCANGS